jgi:hypothetical protein
VIAQRRLCKWAVAAAIKPTAALDFTEDLEEFPSVPCASDLISVHVVRTDPTRNASNGKEVPVMRRLVVAVSLVVLVVAEAVPAHASVDGEFFFPCPLSHRAMDDPIVYPGQPGASHMHDFFGNNSTDAFSTAKSLAAHTTECRIRKDKSAYWIPELYRHGVRVKPVKIQVYYRNRANKAPRPFPFGLKLVQGDHMATSPQYDWAHREFWSCDAGPHHVKPTNCPAGTYLIMNIRFPQCWDGFHLDRPDHHSHMAYPDGNGKCPANHPVVLPMLLLEVQFNIHNGGKGGFKLASGSIYGIHGDFFEAWNHRKLASLIRSCIDKGVSCHL